MSRPALPTRRRFIAGLASLVAGGLAAPRIARAAGNPSELRIDYATYNPVGLLIRDKGWLEEELKADGIAVRWVQSLGSNKALEFLNAGSIDFGSTAGAAALIGRINGNPIKSVYVYSRPEWTALVTRSDTGIAAVADLKGRRVAATRGTDPHIFLIRALASAGLKEKDITLVPLQHGDGKAALIRGDVDAWAGLDPIMAGAEVENGAKLFFRDPALNSWGVLNVREAFAAAHPELVRRVLAVYEKGHQHALANPADLKQSLIATAKLPDAVIERQLTRTDLSTGAIGDAQRQTLVAAGQALQGAGVIKAEIDVPAAVNTLIDPRFGAQTQ